SEHRLRTSPQRLEVPPLEPGRFGSNASAAPILPIRGVPGNLIERRKPRIRGLSAVFLVDPVP
ncbi:MAG: hypothetical protein OSB12_09410, partial [Planctomycetota bacterium]|nr:hypothetical protein [Planctomycetota bacterium]